MNRFGGDLLYGLRLLRRHPSYAVLALLTIALGIGANTAVFSILRGVLFQPLPYQEPDRLLWLGGKEGRFGSEGTGISIPNVLTLRERASSLGSVAAYSFFAEKLVLTGVGEPEQVDGVRVTANYFDTLGVRPAAGRIFRPGEDVRGAPRVAILGHDLWVRNYAADQGVIGQTITLNSISHEIIGVLGPEVRYPVRAAVWVPVAIGTAATQMREAHSFLAVARMASGRTVAQSASEIARVGAEIEREFPTSNTGYQFVVEPLKDHVAGPVRDTLYLMGAVTALLLLIGAANVANLLLARATSRRREIAVRFALGAPRAAIVAQLLAESLVLSLGGTIAGSAVAWWLVRSLRIASPDGLPRAAELGVDPVALVFATGLAGVTTILFGLAPALQATRGEQADALRDAGSRGGGEGAGRARLRNLLVVTELALAVVLLAGAGLLLESLRQLLSVDPGFQPGGVVTTELTLPMRKFRTLDATAAFVESYVERLRAQPGIQSAGAALSLPMGSVYAFYEFRIAGDPPQPIPPFTGSTAVTAGYLETMGIPLRKGRFFDQRDGASSPRVLVISEPMERQYFPGRNAVGQRLQMMMGGPEPFEAEIIGVAGGVRHENLAQAPRVEVYVPLTQSPYPIANIVVRSNAPMASVAAGLKATMRELDRDMPLYRVRSLSDVVAESAAAPRIRGLLTAAFALAALVLASVGIYSVMSYTVSRRTREIGIRMAIGATPATIMGLVVGQSARLVGIGLLLGLALAVAAARLLESLLYGVGSFSPAVLGGVCVLLTLVAMAATALPARRASRVDPVRALREE